MCHNSLLSVPFGSYQPYGRFLNRFIWASETGCSSESLQLFRPKDVLPIKERLNVLCFK